MTRDQRPPILLRLRPAYLFVADIAIALVLTGLAIASAVEATPSVDEPTWLSVLVGTLVGLPLAVRRRRPAAVLLVVMTVATVAIALRWLPMVAAATVFAVAAFAIYPVAQVWPARRSLAALVASVGAIGAAIAVAGWVEPLEHWTDTLTLYVAFSVAPVAACAMGRAVGARRAYEARAAERALVDERLRIARDLHDGVAHSLSLITVQASVANHVAADRPEEARSALAVIEGAGREALRELRRMLGVLRSSDDGAAGGPADPELEPAPTADRLAELAGRASTAGVSVDLDVTSVDNLPSAVGLSVYRIVQESLTNIVKHAAPARCWVKVDGSGGAVSVEVVDDGARAVAWPAGGEGHGLIGMRERVSLFAGEFTAGPLAGGGFRVYAELPLESVTPA